MGREDLQTGKTIYDIGKAASEFTCVCGKQKGWITDGEEHPNPCPNCGRRYRGQYNPKTYQIDAIELTELKEGEDG